MRPNSAATRKASAPTARCSSRSAPHSDGGPGRPWREAAPFLLAIGWSRVKPCSILLRHAELVSASMACSLGQRCASFECRPWTLKPVQGDEIEGIIASADCRARDRDRKSVVEGKRGAVRVDLGGGGI